MTFRYKIITRDLCRAKEFFSEYGCIGGTFSCPDHAFVFMANFKDKIPTETLDHYSKDEDFSIRMI